jgi:hypothetical protein
MVEIMNTQAFSMKIEQVVKDNRIGYFDAVIWYCEQNEIEIETGAKLINTIIKKKIEAEASDANLLKEKSAKLPV